MATYTAIAGAEIDAESPITTGLMTKLRDNPIALYENSRFYKLKTADEEVSIADTGAALQDDDDLFITLVKDEVWEYKFVLFVRTTANADFRFKIVGPDLGTEYFSYWFWRDGAVIEIVSRGNVGLETSFAYGGLSNYVSAPCIIHGLIRTDGAGGTFKLQWAQGNAHADLTGVGAGSFLVAHRLDDL